MHTVARIACLALTLFATSSLSPQNDAATRYFIVGPVPGSDADDSYVLPLSDPAAIQHARQLADFARDGRWSEASKTIVVANIEPAMGFENQDYLPKGGTPVWSWRATGLAAFSDDPPGMLNGSPMFVEKNLKTWMSVTGGQVGFWSYSVVGEHPFQWTTMGPFGLKASPWFGVYWDLQWPWVYHSSLGWICVFGLDPESIWFYMPEEGYVWTNEHMYPWAWKNDSRKWVYLQDPYLSS